MNRQIDDHHRNYFSFFSVSISISRVIFFYNLKLVFKKDDNFCAWIEELFRIKSDMESLYCDIIDIVHECVLLVADDS